jgi:hypothetical protein
MKTEMKVLIAIVVCFSIGFAGLSTIESLDAAIYDSDDKVFTNETAKEFNSGEVWDDDVQGSEPVLKYTASAVTKINERMQSTNSFILNNSNAKVNGGLYYDRGYTATSIDMVDTEGDDKYSKAYYEKGNDGSILKTYWLFKVKITFSAQSYPGYFVYQDILSEINLETTPLPFMYTYYSAADALSMYGDVEVLSGSRERFVGTYTAEVQLAGGLSVVKTKVQWSIVARDISNVEVKVTPVSSDDVGGEVEITVTDPEIGYKLTEYNSTTKKGDYKKTIDWNMMSGKLTGVNVIDDKDDKVAFGNYKGVKSFSLLVNPTPFEGTVHVNIIQTDGNLSADMFTDDNTFVYPNGLDYTYSYDDNGNLVLNKDNEFPVIYRSYCKIVVRDASGQIVIDEIAGKTTGKTASEWNCIELYGANGYVGCATGSFFLDLPDGTPGLIFNAAGTKVIGYDGTSTNVVIPATNNGVKVTKIADKAFYNNKTIESVVIGDNVAQVGMKAFANCSNLKSVVFGDSVKIIYSYAFFGCKNLEMLDFGLNLTNVKLKAFGSVTLQDVEGNVIDAVSANLKGNTFEGSKGVLKAVA